MSDYIATRVMNGLPLSDIAVIDGHAHLGHFPSFNVSENNATSLVNMMDRLGIGKVIASANLSIGIDYKYGNSLLMQAIERYPDRFFGYATLNPNYSSEMASEINRCVSHSGIMGFKVHAEYHESTIDSKGYQLVYEAAEKLKCPVLIHTWGKSDVAAVDRVAEKFPNAKLIMGHAGADNDAMMDSFQVVKKHKNVYIDTALSLPLQGNIEWFVANVDSKKIVFGTDMPLFDPRATIARIALADIKENDKMNILGRNMLRLLSF